MRFLTFCPQAKKENFLQPPLGRLCQPLCSAFARPWAWSYVPVQQGTVRHEHHLLWERGRRNVLPCWRSLQGQWLSSSKSCLKGSIFVCLRRVLGRLSVLRNVQVKNNTKCVCLAVFENRKHRLDCAENCKVFGYRKRFFNLTFVRFRFRVSIYW